MFEFLKRRRAIERLATVPFVPSTRLCMHCGRSDVGGSPWLTEVDCGCRATLAVLGSVTIPEVMFTATSSAKQWFPVSCLPWAEPVQRVKKEVAAIDHANCRNCGAPRSGEPICSYCGTAFRFQML